ncbi:hypothetical protein Tco_1477626, partial [Tanacetum coccineum]
QRLETIFGRLVNRVYVLDFDGLTEGMRHTLAGRLRMVYTQGEEQELFTSYAWRRLFEIRTPLVQEFILEFLSTFRMSDIEMGLMLLTLYVFSWVEPSAYWLGSKRVIPDKGDLSDYWINISSDRDFLGPSPSYVFIQDPMKRLCHRMISCSIYGRGHAPKKVTGVDLFFLRRMDRGTANVPYLLAQYLFRHAKGRKSGARLSRGYFIGRLATHFRLVSDQGLRAWVAPGLERQPSVAAGAGGAAEDAHAVNEGAQADPALVQAPQPPPAAPRTMPKKIARVKEDVHELRRSIVGLHGDVDRSITNHGRFTTWMVSCMNQLMDASGRTYQTFDNTLVGSSQFPYQRCARRRTGDASTLAPQQPDP